MLDQINDLKRLAHQQRGPLHTVTIAPHLRAGAMVTGNAQIIRVTLARIDGTLPSPLEWKVISTLFGYPDLGAMVDVSQSVPMLVSTWSKDSPPKDAYRDYPALYRPQVVLADQCYAEARYLSEYHLDLEAAQELRDRANRLTDEVYHALENQNL